MKEDSRHDSGLDLDLSSSDLHITEHDQGHPGQTVQNHSNQNGVLNNNVKVQGQSLGSKGHGYEGVLPKWSWLRMRKQYFRPSLERKRKCKGSHHRHRGSPRRDYFSRGSEYTGYPDYSPYLSGRIRDSISDIAHHMELMDSLTNQLHSSITMDMVRYNGHVTSSGEGRDPPLPYGDYSCASYQAPGSSPSLVYHAGSRVPYIAGSIVDSYNMDRDSDTVSYVSNHLSSASRSKDRTPNDVTANGHRMTSDEPCAAGTTNCHDVMSSRDNLLPREQIYTLESDMYYPTATSSSVTSASSTNLSSPSRQHHSRQTDRQTHRSGKRTRKHQPGTRIKYKKHQKHKLYPHPESSPDRGQQPTFNISFV